MENIQFMCTKLMSNDQDIDTRRSQENVCSVNSMIPLKPKLRWFDESRFVEDERANGLKKESNLQRRMVRPFRVS